jgi:hypothetical protein
MEGLHALYFISERGMNNSGMRIVIFVIARLLVSRGDPGNTVTY